MQPNEQPQPQPPTPEQPVQPVQPVQTPAPTQEVPMQQQPSAQFTQPAQPAPSPAAPAMPETALDDHPDAEPAFDGAESTQPVRWQSPEYIAHPKPPIWFIGFWAFVIALMAVAALLVKSWSFTILVPVMAAALMIYSHRPPRTLSYVLSAKGLYINDVLHPLPEFRTFGVIQDESIPALMLIPVKRFRPGLTVYFPQESGEAIVDLLGSRIPMEELRLDVFDQIVRKLRI